MIKVQYPEPDFRIRKEAEKAFLFDTIRKAWVRLSEEEWVRQNFVQFLVKMMSYPASLIALEKEISLFGLRKRFDVLVYDNAHQPWMLIECKAPSVRLSEDVLRQVLSYHMSVPVSFIVITNGEVTVAWKKEGGKLLMLEAMPAWDETAKSH